MRIVDLSHPIEEGMPVYPGTQPPSVRLASAVAEHGFAERILTLTTHTGTHVDVPAHLLAGGKTLDDFPVARFLGRAAVVDATGCVGRTIGLGDLEPSRQAILGSRFVLLHTGWSRYWGRDAYFQGFPVLDLEAAAWLAAQGLGGVGVDAPSVDPMDGGADGSYPVHRVLLEGGMVIVENLTDLHLLPQEGAVFACFPLPVRGGDGAPVRAVAFFGAAGGEHRR
jgi:kynurenine formamidase